MAGSRNAGRFIRSHTGRVVGPTRSDWSGSWWQSSSKECGLLPCHDNQRNTVHYRGAYLWYLVSRPLLPVSREVGDSPNRLFSPFVPESIDRSFILLPPVVTPQSLSIYLSIYLSYGQSSTVLQTVHDMILVGAGSTTMLLPRTSLFLSLSFSLFVRPPAGALVGSTSENPPYGSSRATNQPPTTTNKQPTTVRDIQQRHHS